VGVLGYGGLTGESETPATNHYEPVEQEAHNFVSSYGVIQVGSGGGKHSEIPFQEVESTVEKPVSGPADLR
jgi:hypothetical protein